MAAGFLEVFYPQPVMRAALPAAVPKGITAEFREAEVCASVDAWRAACAMLRSALEKAFSENGYIKDSLAKRIDQAASEGVITEPRRKRAHEDVRVLGNDILHEEWREVGQKEYDLARHYVQRVLEDLYDDRAATEAVLIKAGRLKAAPTPEP